MKISYLIPEGQYRFFQDLFVEMEAAGHEVFVNQIGEYVDVVLAAMLPATPKLLDQVERFGGPVAAWHWDHYSFVDMTDPRWSRFNRLITESDNVDVWSCGYEVARLLKEQHGLDSVVMPGWINHSEIVKGNPGRFTEEYAFYAATSDSLGKRTDWAVRACQILEIPLVLTKGLPLSRRDYLDRLAGCRVYLMTAFEESNATLPATEAAALGKAVVCADLPNSREVFGRHGAWYFRNDSFQDLLDRLKMAWDHPGVRTCRERVCSLFDLSVIAPKIIERLEYLHARR